MIYNIKPFGNRATTKTEYDVLYVEKCIKAACKINKKLFRSANFRFTVKLFYSRAAYDREIKHKTLRWAHAAANRNRVAIFAPSVYEKLTTHKLDIYKSTVIHEINHLFYMRTAGTYTPRWLLEGLAMNVEGRNYSSELGWRGKPKLDYLYFAKRPKTDKEELEFYRSSYLTVKSMISEIGLDGVAKLLQNYSTRPIKSRYKKLFNRFIN